jgi:hypothetical protein
MKPFADRSPIFLLVPLLVAVTLPASATPTDMSLDRVLLSNGGVAYLEYQSTVQGDATLELPIPLKQVDDVLMSLVVFDDGGSVTAVSLPGREPLAQRFRELPFSPSDLRSATALLNALRGEQVQIDQPRRLQGRLLSVDEVQVVLPDNLGRVTRHRVSIIGEQGLQQAVLEDANALNFSDPTLQDQVQEALSAIAAYRDQDTRTLTITTRGPANDTKDRAVRAGYVTAAPLWKASYRMVLEAGSDEAHLQGWAHLENLSGQDWKQVSLTLASGNPVTFRQALYQAYFVERPEVPVEVSGRVLPQMDSGALTQITAAPAPATVAPMVERKYKRRKSSGWGARRMGMAVAAMDAEEESFGDRANAPSAPAMAEMVTAGATTDVAEQVLFTLPHPLDLANGHALMTPIVDAPFPAQRLSLYQPATHPEYPLDSVRLENKGDLALPPGVMTLYGSGQDGNSFLGDARMDGLPAGDNRLLSFALDRKLRIKRDQLRQQTITGGKISKGVLYLQRRERRLTYYQIHALAKRTLWVEHPIHSGWTLTQPKDALVQTTRDQYRLQFDLVADEQRKVEVIEERPMEELLTLNTLSPRQLAAFASGKTLSPALRRVFAHIGDLRQTMLDAEHRVNTLNERINQVHRDQKRLRDNMRNLNQRSDLYRRYVDKLGRQEDRLEDTQRELITAKQKVEAARKTLNRYIDGVKL